jgi:serine/threonine protein kinase
VKCPDSARLQLLLDGGLAAKELAAIDAHVEQCPTCQALLHARLLTGPAAAVNCSPRSSSPRESQMTGPSLHSFAGSLRELHLLDAAQQAELDRDLGKRWRDPKDLARELFRRGWLTAYQVNQLNRGKGQELVLGSYVLLEPLGAGGMGQVFKARHRTLDRLCALKVIRKERVASAEAVSRFLREGKAAARLLHPNIITIFDADQAGGVYFLAMELIEGTDLAKLVAKQGPLPLAQACSYVQQAALGLQHAHEQGLVHRDVKPHNLMLKADGSQVKVLDLGLALIAAGPRVTTLTETGVCMGTPAFMAPEQAMNAHTADIRSDIYSLGCTLFYLLTARPPFTGATAVQVLAGHLQGEIPALTPAVAGAPPELDVVLRRMLAKKPEDRLQTPAEAAETLAQFIRPKSEVGPATMPTINPALVPGGGHVPEQQAQAAAGATISPELGSAAEQRREAGTMALPAPHRRPARRRRLVAVLLAGIVLIGTAAIAYFAWPRLGGGNRPTDRSLANRDETAAPPTKIDLKQPPPNSLKHWSGVTIRIGTQYMSSNGGVGPEVVGSGKRESVTRQVPGFSAITLLHPARVTVVPGEKEEVTVTAEDNLLRLLGSEVTGGTLQLGVADGSRVQANQPIDFEVKVKVLKRLQLQHQGTIEAREVRADLLEVVLSNNGEVTVSGQANDLKLTLGHNGTFLGSELTTRGAILELKNSGRAVVNVTDHLEIVSGGPGVVVEYLGSPPVVAKPPKFKGQLRPIKGLDGLGRQPKEK